MSNTQRKEDAFVPGTVHLVDLEGGSKITSKKYLLTNADILVQALSMPNTPQVLMPT